MAAGGPAGGVRQRLCEVQEVELRCGEVLHGPVPQLRQEAVFGDGGQGHLDRDPGCSAGEGGCSGAGCDEDRERQAEPRPSAKKKPRLCRAQSKHAHLVDGILQITVRGHDFAVLYEGMGKAEFWMEALPENIEFFHSELQKDEPKNRKAKAKKKTKAPAARRAGEEGSGSD